MEFCKPIYQSVKLIIMQISINIECNTIAQLRMQLSHINRQLNSYMETNDLSSPDELPEEFCINSNDYAGKLGMTVHGPYKSEDEQVDQADSLREDDPGLNNGLHF